MIKRTKAIAKKEVKQLSRDIRMLFVILFFPVFLLMIFGYAVNFDVKHIKLAILDKSKSAESSDFIDSFTKSDYFDIVKYLDADRDVKHALDKKEAQIVLVIPTDFSESVITGKNPAKVQFLIDGVDGNTATIVMNYVNGATLGYSMKIQKKFLARKGGNFYQPINLEARYWFNPELESTKFLIPGLIAMILIVTAVVSVSLSLVREKERGTIEQINVSSINTLELLIGKSLPYIILALLNAVFILTAGYFLFDIAVKGSFLWLFITTLIFIISSVSLGILVSVIADSQQIAFTISTFASLLPSVILSGFIFPIESMPSIIQVITNITPAKFFIVALRAIVLRGVGPAAYWDQLLYLVLFGFIMLAAASIISKKKAGAV